jgi:hypothetical protein
VGRPASPTRGADRPVRQRGRSEAPVTAAKGRTKPGRRADRLARTILLGGVVVLLAIAWLARELGMDRAELLGYAKTIVLGVGLLALLGLAGAAVVVALRRLRR